MEGIKATRMDAIARSASDYRADLATKADINLLRSEVQATIAESLRDTMKQLWLAVAVIITLSGGINAGVSAWISQTIGNGSSMNSRQPHATVTGRDKG